VLLHTLEWLCARREFEIEILVIGTGVLLDNFRVLGPTLVWRNPANRLKSLGFDGSDLGSCLFKLRTLGRSYDLVYLNTSALGLEAAVLRTRTKRLLWHIHELEYAIGSMMGIATARRRFELADRFISVSCGVTDVLNRTFNIPRERIDLVHEFVTTPRDTPDAWKAKRQTVLERLGWPADSFVVGACGGLGWRKGTDLFVQVANLLASVSDGGSYRFLWVGGAQGDEALRFHHDVRHFGIADRCALVSETGEVSDYYHSMDVFALTSREDPFPLVMLEAGACRIPTVCFAGGGGGPEYVAHNPDLVAPYLDIGGFASRVDALRRNMTLRQLLGEEATRKVHAEHVVETQGPKILASIERCLAGA
jgi:glycosyltransferase involved in cell wall biosynthesis